MQDKNKRNTRKIHQKYMMEILPFDWPVRSSSLLSLALDAKFKATLPMHSILGNSSLCFCIFVFFVFLCSRPLFYSWGDVFVSLYCCIYCQIQFLFIYCIFISSLRPCYHCRCRLSLESCQFFFWSEFLFFIICSVFHFSSKMGRQSLINLIPN